MVRRKMSQLADPDCFLKGGKPYSNGMARRLLVILAVFLVAAAFAAPEANGADLRLGCARVEITPPIGFPLEGYESRKSGSTGVHDPLYARVLVVKSPETSIAFVALDLVAFVSDAVVKGAREKYGVERVAQHSPCNVAAFPIR